MITAIDTNILLDILIPDQTHFASSKTLLDEYVTKGQLIICGLVYAELSSQFFDEQELQTFLSDTGIRINTHGKHSRGQVYFLSIALFHGESCLLR